MNTKQYADLSQEEKDLLLLRTVKDSVTPPKEINKEKIETLLECGADPLALFDAPFDHQFIFHVPNEGRYSDTNICAFECLMSMYSRSDWLLRGSYQQIPGHLQKAEEIPAFKQNMLEIFRLFMKHGMDLTRPHKHYSWFFKSMHDLPAENNTFLDNFLSSEDEMKLIIELENDLPKTLHINPQKHKHFITKWSIATCDTGKDGAKETQEIKEWPETVIKACAILVKKGVKLPESYEKNYPEFFQLVQAELTKPIPVASEKKYKSIPKSFKERYRGD